MEDTLGAPMLSFLIQRAVLILVLMEDTLGVNTPDEFLREIES